MVKAKNELNWTYIIVAIIVGMAIIISTILIIRSSEKNSQGKYEFEQNKINALGLCLSDVNEIVQQNYDRFCQELGKESDCLLPENYAKVLQEGEKSEEAKCKAMYKP